MSLPSQVVQAPFRLGLNEGVDPKQAPVGTLMRAQNATWKKSGLLEKRFGTAAMASPSVTAAYRLFTRGDELGLIGDLAIKTYKPSAGWSAAWASGVLPDVGLTWSTLLDDTGGVIEAEIVCLSDGSAWVVWIDGDPTVSSTGVLKYKIVDLASGSTITPTTTLATSVSRMRALVYNGDTPIVLWCTGTSVKSRILATTTTLQTNFANSAFDACIIGDTFVIAYSKATDIAIMSYSIVATPVQQASDVVGDAVACQAVSIDGDVNDLLFVGYWKTTPAFRFCTHNPTTLAQVQTPADIDTTSGVVNPQIGVLRTSATSCVYSYSCNGNATTDSYSDGLFASYVVSSSGTKTVTRKTYGKRALTRPFSLNGKVYAFIADFINAKSISGVASSAPFADGYLVEVDTATASAGTTFEMHRYVGHTHLLTAGNWLARWTANVTVGPESEILFAAPFQSASTATYSGVRQGLHLFRAWPTASRPGDLWRPVNINQETYFAGGALTGFDGVLAFDYGMGSPAYVAQTNANNGAGSIVAGTYLYSAVTEWRSGAGVLHRGPAAITLSVTVTAPSDTVDIYMLHPELSLRINAKAGTFISKAATALYRTVVNGTTLQRLTVEPSYAYTAAVGGGSDAIVYHIDLAPDSNVGGSNTLASRPALYTASVNDDYQPPASVSLFYHADRLWLLAGDERTFWYSKAFQDDLGVAPGFHPDFRFVFPEKMYGGASMDEKGIFFSAASIWYLTGNGPAPNGENSDFGLPQKIQTDSGCTNARSIVAMPEGIMFEGSGDIFLLNRGLEVEWVGKPVQEQLDAFPVITSAVLLTLRNEVRFTCNAADGETGIVLVYNYVEKQWSWFEYTDTVAAQPSTPIADAILWQGLYTFVTPAGNVFQEDDSTYLDGGTDWVEMDVESAEIFAEGPLSYQRVRRAYFKGELGSNCDVQVRVITGGNSGSYDQTRDWDSTAIATVGANVGVHVKKQRGDSIRIRLTDATPSGGESVGTGQGLTLSAMGFEIAPKGGMDKRRVEAKK